MGQALKKLFLLALLLPFAACSESESVQLALVAPLTGEAAVYGVPIRQGAELAFEEIQQQQGFPYELELLVTDSESDPDKARQQLESFFEAGGLGAIGGITSAEAIRMVDAADAYDRILISPSASSPGLSGISKNFYRIYPSDFREGSQMGSSAAQKLGVRTVVVLAAESVYGRGIEEVFRTQFERFDGRILEVLTYPEGTGDFSGLVERALSLQPEGIYLADFAGPTGALVESLRRRGFKGRIMATSAFAAPDVLEAVGDSAEGVVLTKPVYDTDSEDPNAQEFVAKYQAKYGEEPGLYAAHGYDAMMVMAEALSKAVRPTRNEFRKGLKSIHDFEGVTGLIQFDEAGDVQKYPRVYMVVEGKLIDHDRFVTEERERIRKRLETIRRQRG